MLKIWLLKDLFVNNYLPFENRPAAIPAEKHRPELLRYEKDIITDCEREILFNLQVN
jgi:hypothetical protein